MGERRGLRIGVLAGLIIVQTLIYNGAGPVALAFLVGLGLGIWIREWRAAIWALATFAIAFTIAAVSGWLDPVRIWDLILGAALAILGGLIGGGIFQVVRYDLEAGDSTEGGHDQVMTMGDRRVR